MYFCGWLNITAHVYTIASSLSSMSVFWHPIKIQLILIIQHANGIEPSSSGKCKHTTNCFKPSITEKVMNDIGIGFHIRIEINLNIWMCNWKSVNAAVAATPLCCSHACSFFLPCIWQCCDWFDLTLLGDHSRCGSFPDIGYWVSSECNSNLRQVVNFRQQLDCSELTLRFCMTLTHQIWNYKKLSNWTKHCLCLVSVLYTWESLLLLFVFCRVSANEIR